MTEEINSYDVGAGVVMEARFTRNSVPANPTTVVLKVKTPDGGEVTVAGVTNPEVGHFVGEYVVADHGDYYYRFEGDGAVSAAGERRFRVRRSQFS